MDRRQVERRRAWRRAVVLVSCAALFGALLAVPLQTIGAPRAQAAEVPACPPDSTSNNCLPADQTYDGATHPALPELGPVEPAGGLLVRQRMTVEGPTIGGMCPFGSIPYSAMPCTHFGVLAGGRVYVPGADEAGSPSTYGINVSDETREGYTCSGWSQDFTCPLVITYNPSTLAGSVTLIISVSTTVVGDLNGDGNILDGLGYSFAVTISGTGTPPPPPRTRTTRRSPGSRSSR